MLEAKSVVLSRGERRLVDEVSVSVKPGEFWALLGPNGAGKSTLLKVLSGQWEADSGSVLVDGRTINAYTAGQLSLKRAVLSQIRTVGFPFTCQEVVMLGRHPHVGTRGETPRDREVVENCMKRMDAGVFRNRKYNTLSGGEATRVDIARILTQETHILLLDEPTNHLDPRHQVAIMQLCTELRSQGHCIIAAVHDLNLAAHFATHSMVMKNGKTVASGETRDILRPELLSEVYETPFELIERPGGGFCVVPVVPELS